MIPARYRRFFKLSLKDKLWIFLYYAVVGFFIAKFQNWYNLSGKYKFINRSEGRGKLLIIVAGYKEFLWDVSLKRIKRFIDDDIDVCVCVPKADNEKLRKIAKENGWSYLVTNENKLSLAQNIAINLHQKAKYIYKLDEDIIISKDYFQNIYDTYLKIKKDGLYNLGLVVPLLNINGCSYIHFLKFVQAEREYKEKFGELKSSIMEIRCHYDPQAALYLWSKSFPFDDLAQKINKYSGVEYEIIPHRFSIGAIFFDRQFFNKAGKFKVAPEGFLGIEESDICQFSFENSNPILLAKNTFAGHFSFGPQNDEMKKYFLNHKNKFDI